MIFFEADLSDDHVVLQDGLLCTYDTITLCTIRLISFTTQLTITEGPSNATYNKSRYLVCFDNIRCYYVLYYNVMFKIKIKTNGRAILNDPNTVSVNVRKRLFTLLDILNLKADIYKWHGYQVDWNWKLNLHFRTWNYSTEDSHMVILFEIISIYKSVTMIKQVYKIKEYFLRPHSISVSLSKSSHGILSVIEVFFRFRC